MGSPNFKTPRAAIYVGLLCVAGAAILSRATPSCPVGPWLYEKSTESKVKVGDENMPVTSGTIIQHASDANFDRLVLKSDVPVLVDFYADWCGPCQRLTPILEELARDTPSARVVKVNVEYSPSLAAQYGVDSIPSLKLFKNGVVADQFVGLADKRQLKSMLAR